jgi:hypothetical protein
MVSTSAAPRIRTFVGRQADQVMAFRRREALSASDPIPALYSDTGASGTGSSNPSPGSLVVSEIARNSAIFGERTKGVLSQVLSQRGRTDDKDSNGRFGGTLRRFTKIWCFCRLLIPLLRRVYPTRISANQENVTHPSPFGYLRRMRRSRSASHWSRALPSMVAGSLISIVFGSARRGALSLMTVGDRLSKVCCWRANGRHMLTH